ncbi:hypothetical protein TWF281_004914 [Arthrobotrys megalospora]
MSRAFNAATKIVTTDDELITTLEGIECIMMESMYLNNAGNLRRAWLANRRAMGMAQMMRLHVGTTSWPARTLEEDTRGRIDPKYMWFRLVVSDRYLSLMLGLPQGSVESSFANPALLDACTPLERMERVESVATSLILQRNSAERIDLASTYKIDTMLREAAALMPPQWWIVSHNLTAIAGNDAEAFEESIRLTAQFAHYHLLVQLHLPYLLLPSSQGQNYDYNKMIAANSSREVLTRFVSFRASNSAPAYCRGIDFITFIASTTLCLAHMQALRPRGNDATFTTFQALQHQRLSDRGLLQRSLEFMETMALTNNDVVARKISNILRPLLAIEGNTLQGGCYQISASTETDLQESQSIGATSDAVHGVRVQIPYFGTVQIEHRPIVPERGGVASNISTAPESSLLVFHEPVSVAGCSKRGEGTQKSHPAGYELTTDQPVNTDWQSVTLLPEPTTTADSNETLQNVDGTGVQETYLLVPGLTADLDDWVLQGVDMALFSNLTAANSNFLQ